MRTRINQEKFTFNPLDKNAFHKFTKILIESFYHTYNPLKEKSEHLDLLIDKLLSQKNYIFLLDGLDEHQDLEFWFSFLKS